MIVVWLMDSFDGGGCEKVTEPSAPRTQQSVPLVPDASQAGDVTPLRQQA